VRPQFEFRERPSALLARRPRVVSAAAVLWAVAGVLTAVAALLMLLDLDGLKTAVRTVVEQGFPQAPAATRDRVIGPTAWVLVSGGAVGLLQIVVARRLHAGRGGPRFPLVLLLALAVVEVVLAIGVVGLAVRLTLLLGVACGLVGTVFMYSPGANLWFAARRS
jgi:UPF0716 family protein affecting phage T7 exclusion